MGIYDTFVGDNIAVQIKYTNDEESMPTYNIGDDIDMDNCVLIGYEGVVVIIDNKVVLVTENVMDKWGCILDCHEMIGMNNPIQNTVDNLMERYQDDTDLTISTEIDGDDFMEEIVDA